MLVGRNYGDVLVLLSAGPRVKQAGQRIICVITQSLLWDRENPHEDLDRVDQLQEIPGKNWLMASGSSE
jgi:hypothetical protein